MIPQNGPNRHQLASKLSGFNLMLEYFHINSYGISSNSFTVKTSRYDIMGLKGPISGSCVRHPASLRNGGFPLDVYPNKPGRHFQIEIGKRTDNTMQT